MNTNDWSVKVAVLRVRRDQIIAKYEAARKLAEGVYAPLRLNGSKSWTPVLPGGAEAGTLSVKAGHTDVVFDEDVLLGLVREAEPEHVEEFVSPSALADKRVLDLVREHLPELVGQRVAAGRRSELKDACVESDGFLVNTITRKRVKVASVFRVDPTGEFAYAPGKQGTAAILAALEAGTVTEDGEIAPPAPERTVTEDGEILVPVAGDEPAAGHART